MVSANTDLFFERVHKIRPPAALCQLACTFMFGRAAMCKEECAACIRQCLSATMPGCDVKGAHQECHNGNEEG